MWPEVWTKIGKAVQKREQQELANEKPKLDNARRLRGICFIDSEDEAYKETIINASGKGGSVEEREFKQAHRKRERKIKNLARFQKTKYACIVEGHESTRQMF